MDPKYKSNARHPIQTKSVDKTTQIVAERAERDIDPNVAINQKITENSVSVQNYPLILCYENLQANKRDSIIFVRIILLFTKILHYLKQLWVLLKI